MTYHLRCETDVPVSYTVVLETVAEGSGAHFVRAIATSATDQSVSEAFLTRGQTRSILEFANEKEPSIVDNYMKELDKRHAVEIRSSKGELRVFLAEQLVTLGWKHDDLEMGFCAAEPEAPVRT